MSLSIKPAKKDEGKNYIIQKKNEKNFGILFVDCVHLTIYINIYTSSVYLI